MKSGAAGSAGRGGGCCALLLGLALLLAGCVPEVGGFAAAPLRLQAVLAGAVTVAAPRGYCVEPTAVLETADTALVLIGRCTGGAANPRAPAILSAAVSGPGSGLDIATSAAALAGFFGSEPGRAALSRSGSAATVTVLEAGAVGEVFVISLRDTSPDPTASAESWRAVLALAGRLVTLTVSGTSAAPLDPEAGRALLDRFVAAMQAANRGTVG
ncbi:MAG: cation transport ATPase [Pseudorhodobacter sp.]|nr:cation transport ATPase [Pseudorhodobacter sp.]